MVTRRWACWVVPVIAHLVAASAWAQQAGSIRGMVYDKDFSAPLPLAQVLLVETGEQVTSGEQGNYVFQKVPPGRYTLVFSKDGYTRQVKGDVIVSGGGMTEADGWLSGDFEEMDEFVVQDVDIGGGSEENLLALRSESPSMVDSIGSELLSRTGVSNAAGALNYVPGASVQDGKYAVIRGMPDRYVSSQMNGIRLPTADKDKRAVQLDQFPSEVIESIQVSKTFTPDQQDDASGGAVNLVLKGIPDRNFFKLSSGASFNSQVTGNHHFLTYKGAGTNFWGKQDRDIPLDGIFGGAVGVSRRAPPQDSNWSLSGGGSALLADDVKVGGFTNFYYRTDSSYFDGGKNDRYWVETPGAIMTPYYYQGTPATGTFYTSLYDVAQSMQETRWGWLATVGAETRYTNIDLIYLCTRAATSTTTLNEDTRGKSYYFPGYNADNPMDPGNQARDAAPYLRQETLDYIERTTETLQLRAKHTAPTEPFGVDRVLTILPPEMDWSVAHSSSSIHEPDKVQFGSQWLGPKYFAGFPPWVPPFVQDGQQKPLKPAANFTLGNLQRIWKDISEDSDQYWINLKLPFEQWTEDQGFMKLGLFRDRLRRDYDQDSFSNFNDNAAEYDADFSHLWSAKFPYENHPVTEADIDVDYVGKQEIRAWYWMTDFPLTSFLKATWGARYEITKLSIENDPEKDVFYYPPGATGPVAVTPDRVDVDRRQRAMMPSIGCVVTPIEALKLRASYSRTIARPTFRELTPIMQQEYLGGDVFVGNPDLNISRLKNYDLRADFTPRPGSFFSTSFFKKRVEDPIEYTQRVADFTYTTPINYPKGWLKGWEFEVRQDLGQLWDALHGLSFGANATLIRSEVNLPEDEAEDFEAPNIMAPMRTRDMMNAPSHLYNLNLTYDIDQTGTQMAIFYTVRGDTLIAGAGQSSGHFVPSVYERERGSLNFSVSQKFLKYFTAKFQAKNLTNPKIETVYRSKYIGEDIVRTGRRDGIDYSIGLYMEVDF